jgi:hypothetical protein
MQLFYCPIFRLSTTPVACRVPSKNQKNRLSIVQDQEYSGQVLHPQSIIKEYFAMSSETYLVRRDIAQTIRIDQLVKENAGLIIKLQDSEAAIGRLRFQIERMEDGTQTLTIRLEDSIKEIGRMAVALKHRKAAIKPKKPSGQKAILVD